MHSITSVRISALHLFKSHLLDIFTYHTRGNKIHENVIYQNIMCKNFKGITLLVEMLILDVENESIPTSKQKEFIYDLIDVIPEKYLLHLCPMINWFQLACTPDGTIFNRKLLMSAEVLKSFTNDRSNGGKNVVKQSLLQNNSIRIEKASTPSTRLILTEIIGKVLSTIMESNMDTQIIKLLLESLRSHKGYNVITAAQVIYSIRNERHNKLFVQNVKSEFVQYSKKRKQYDENKGLRRRILFECQQLQKNMFQKNR